MADADVPSEPSSSGPEPDRSTLSREAARRRAKRRWLLTGVVLFVAAILFAPDRFTSSDDQAVISTVFDDFATPVQHWDAGQGTYASWELGSVLGAVPADLKAGFLVRNRIINSARPFGRDPRLVFLDQASVDAAFDQGFWDEFYRQFPNVDGRVRFTMPAYSWNGQRAAVFLRWGSGGLEAEWSMYVLDKVGGRWRVTKKDVLGVS